MLYCMLYFVFFLKSFDFHVVFTNWPWTHPADNQCNEPQVMASAGVTLFFSETETDRDWERWRGEDARMAGTGNAGVGAVIPRMPTSGRRALRMVSAGHAGDIGHQGCRNARRAGAWNSRFCIPFLQIRKISQIYYFKLVPGDFTDLQQTLHTASVDTPVIKLSKKLWYFKKRPKYKRTISCTLWSNSLA